MPQIASKNLRILHHYLNRLLRNQAMLTNTNCAEIALILCHICTTVLPQRQISGGEYKIVVLTTVICPTGCLWQCLAVARHK